MVTKDKPCPKQYTQRHKNNLSLIIIGLGIGWLAGLSVSPVVSTIIMSIVGVVITLLSALSGLKTQADPSEKRANSESSSRWQIDPIPIALLIIGIVFGSILGIGARTRNWIGIDSHVDVRSEIQKWKVVGIDEKEIAQRLFDREYPPQELSKNADQADIKQSVLFGQRHKECERLLSYSRVELPMQLTISTIEIFNDLPEIIQDPETLEKVVKVQYRVENNLLQTKLKISDFLTSYFQRDTNAKNLGNNRHRDSFDLYGFCPIVR